MEAVRNQNQRQLTLIDAGTLDDEQFSELVDNLDSRNWIIPVIFCLMIAIAGISFIG
jgi:hypothetical protein